MYSCTTHIMHLVLLPPSCIIKQCEAIRWPCSWHTACCKRPSGFSVPHFALEYSCLPICHLLKCQNPDFYTYESTQVVGSGLLYEAFALDLLVRRQRPAGGHDYMTSLSHGAFRRHTMTEQMSRLPALVSGDPALWLLWQKLTLLITSFCVASV